MRDRAKIRPEPPTRPKPRDGSAFPLRMNTPRTGTGWTKRWMRADPHGRSFQTWLRLISASSRDRETGTA